MKSEELEATLKYCVDKAKLKSNFKNFVTSIAVDFIIVLDARLENNIIYSFEELLSYD